MKTLIILAVVLCASPAHARFDPAVNTSGSSEVTDDRTPGWTTTPLKNIPPAPPLKPAVVATPMQPVKTVPIGSSATSVVAPIVNIAPTMIIPSALRDTPNNPLAAPPNIDELLKVRMTEDIWQAMYNPLPCLDTTAECIQRLQTAAVQSSPVLRELDAKIATVNQKIEEAKTNNKKSIELAVFEPALQVFLRQDTVVENGQSRKVGVIDRIGQLFTNPGPVINDLLGAIGIPILKGIYGGNDAQQSRAIQISDLVVKVAEIERGKTEVMTKTRERVQQLVLDFDVYAREFQAEQSIAISEGKSLRLYAVMYAAGDGDTDSYLNRKEKVERTKLQVFKGWARVRAQIMVLKAVVVPRD
jgi:hypothetical protein